MALEGVEAAGQLGPVGLEPFVELPQGLDPQTVEPTLGIATDLDQAGVAQHLEMPGHARLVHADGVDKLGDRTLAAPHGVEYAAAGRFGNHSEDVQLTGHRSNIQRSIYMHKKI